MKTRDTFEEARMRKNRFGLTTRLVLLVTLEIEVCILVALGMDALLILSCAASSSGCRS